MFLKALIVDCEKNECHALENGLKENGIEAMTLFSLAEADAVVHEKTHRIVVMNQKLSDGDPKEYIKNWRKNGFSISIILFGDKFDRKKMIGGLEAGANDFLTKPLDLDEFVARVKVQARTLVKPPTLQVSDLDFNEAQIEHDGVCLCQKTKQVWFLGERVTLQKKEFNLLNLLFQEPGKVYSREEIFQSVWGHELPNTRTVDMHISFLRNKLSANRIETIRGLGYRWRISA